MAEEIQTHLREQMPVWKSKYAGVEELTVAVMGCVVNGPGESKHANIGISLPGTFEEPKAPVFVDGAAAGAPRPARGSRRSQDDRPRLDDPPPRARLALLYAAADSPPRPLPR